MRLYALSRVPKLSALFLADIHLHQQLKFVHKIFSDAIHFATKEMKPGPILELVNPKGEKKFFIGTTPILPPTGKISVWSKWAACNYFNAWWLVDYSYALDAEFKNRFNILATSEEHLRLQDIVLTNIVPKLFPRPKEEGRTVDEFPVSLGPTIGEILPRIKPETDVVDIYKMHYRAQKGRVRMKWTNRERPAFIDAPAPGEQAVIEFKEPLL